MKKIICAFLCIVLLCGCSSVASVEETNAAEEPKSMFVLIEQSPTWKVVYHKDTKCERQKLTFLLWQADTREHTCSYGERKKTDEQKQEESC